MRKSRAKTHSEKRRLVKVFGCMLERRRKYPEKNGESLLDFGAARVMSFEEILLNFEIGWYRDNSPRSIFASGLFVLLKLKKDIKL